MKKHITVKFAKTIFLMLVLICCISVSGYAQETTIRGVVNDNNSSPLPGVSIMLKGTNVGTVTDVDGNYTIRANDNDILVFSFIGYTTQEIAVNKRTSIDVAMTEDVHSLDEVVVVGYGIQKKENVIGSIVSVSEEELTSAPVSSISNALAGRLPGAIFTQTSGEPGNDAANISIRGSHTFGENRPLVVIDGIPGRDLNSLNAQDVESITVLKDASAAIYGARAANGVILVTTKGGAKDMPATFSYNFYEGFLSPVRLPKLTDAPTYATMIREMQSYRGVDESNMMFSREDIEKYKSGEYPWTHPNTNWYEEALRDYSSTRNHNLSVKGGTESINYYGSFGSQFDDGIYTNSATAFNRYNLKLKVNAKVNEHFNVGLDIVGIQENRMRSVRPPRTVYNFIQKMYPTLHATFPGTDLPGPDISYGDQPMVNSTSETGFNDDKRYRSNMLLSADWKIPWVEGLTLSGYYAYDIYNQRRKLFQKPWTLYNFDKSAYLTAGNTGKEDGSDFLIPYSAGYTEPRVTNTSAYSESKTANIKLDYEKTFNDVHNVQAFVAYEQNEYDNGGFEAFRRYYISDQLPYLFAGGDDEKDNSEWVGLDARVNYFGRLSYNYDHTYYFQFSFRRDGSLRFSKESGRWGNFPSVLVGYRPSEQEWWQNSLGFIDDFKVRLSWGQMGNDQVPPFQYLTSYGFVRGYTFGENQTYTAGLDQANVPNPYITWEVANMYNFGLEAGFFNNKLTLVSDFFFERRTDILVKKNVSVPLFTGITLPDENFGIVENRGVELLLSYRERSGDFQYGLSGNFAFSRNKIIEYDEPERPVPWQTRTGNPMNAVLLYKSMGIFSDLEHVNSLPHVEGARPGDIIIEDYDKDGKITTDDRQLFALTATPEITYGVTFDLSYKNWELRALVQGQGRALRNLYREIVGSGGNYYQFDADDRWTPENPNGTKPRAFERKEEYWRDSFITDFYYFNVSFARLKNLQLSYGIPRNITDKVKIKEAKVFASGQNLWLLYSGNEVMDPETGGVDNYPIMKVISLGAKINF